MSSISDSLGIQDLWLVLPPEPIANFQCEDVDLGIPLDEIIQDQPYLKITNFSSIPPQTSQNIQTNIQKEYLQKTSQKHLKNIRNRAQNTCPKKTTQNNPRPKSAMVCCRVSRRQASWAAWRRSGKSPEVHRLWLRISLDSPQFWKKTAISSPWIVMNTWEWVELVLLWI